MNMILQDLSGSNLNKNLMKKTHYRKAPTIFLGISMNMLLSVLFNIKLFILHFYNLFLTSHIFTRTIYVTMNSLRQVHQYLGLSV